jgi:hypothetical protein
LKIEFQGSRATSDGGLILVLTQEENLAGLAAIHRELRAKSEAIASPQRVVLDMGQHRFRRHGVTIRDLRRRSSHANFRLVSRIPFGVRS